MRIRTARELGLLIREERKRQRLTQTALADAIGVRRQWVHQIERGKETAELGLVLRALAALSLRIDVRPPVDPGHLQQSTDLRPARDRRGPGDA